jgi:hypothetical protein
MEPLTDLEKQNLARVNQPSGDSGGIFDGLSDEEILARRNPEGRSDEEVLARQSATSSATGVGNPGEEAANMPPQTKQTALPNPLSDYESYTYGLSLHLLSQTQYNNLIENPDLSYIPQNVLVASAGKNSNNFKRDPNFREDFYFDDFQMKTVVNITTRNRNSNLIECSFTIIEPTGFTFINRLVAACQGIGSVNYLKQPYLLQIDFYGYKDGAIAGSPIPNMSKYIPIALTSMKSRVSTKGTEYKIDAVPYNHQAFSQIHVVSPANFKIKAVTVADMFGTGRVTNVNTEAFKLAQREAAKLERARAGLSAAAAGASDMSPQDLFELKQYELEASAASARGSTFQVSGFCDALNAWFESLKNVNKKITVTNEYKVEFFPEIGDSKLFPNGSVPNDVNNAAAGGSTTAAGKTAARAAGGLPVGTVVWNSGTFNIPMGMQIDKLIDYTVRNSKYISEQLLVPESAASGADLTAIKTKSGSPLKWYKIVPKIKIKQYDPSRQQYAYEITFCVKPWTVNTKYPYTVQGRTPGYVKQYDWIYTGRNTEVIDLQIDFDMLYYQQLTAFPNAKAQGSTGEPIATPAANPDTPLSGPIVPITDPLQPLAVTYVSSDYRTQTLPGAAAAAGTAGGDVQRDLTSSSRGDMINIQLKIIGDPQLIKQDDLFYAQNVKPPTSQLTLNNSLYYDGGELYVNIVFQSPVDYDESTGLARPNNPNNPVNYSYNLFNGIYKIITVDNNFKQGKFEQTLDLIRLPFNAQDIKQLVNARSRIETDVNSGLGRLPALVPAEQLLAAQNAQEGFRAAELGLANRFSPDYTTAEDAFGAATSEEANAINSVIIDPKTVVIDWDIV